MPTAAINFRYGDGKVSHWFSAGDEVPEEIADDVPDSCILERLAEAEPEALSRDQLMRLAGVGPYSDEEPIEAEDDFDEDEFREALGDFQNKGQLVTWANEIYPDLAVDAGMTRPEITDAIVAHRIGEDEE